MWLQIDLNNSKDNAHTFKRIVEMQFGSKQKAKIELCAAMCYFAFVAPYCCCRCASFLSLFFMVLSQACDLLCLYVCIQRMCHENVYGRNWQNGLQNPNKTKKIGKITNREESKTISATHKLPLQNQIISNVVNSMTTGICVSF